jgi:hypothetical protein
LEVLLLLEAVQVVLLEALLLFEAFLLLEVVLQVLLILEMEQEVMVH